MSRLHAMWLTDSSSPTNVHFNFRDTMKQLEDNALLLEDRVRNISGLNVIKPSGAMYVMVIKS